jgi:hypothetical protein
VDNLVKKYLYLLSLFFNIFNYYYSIYIAIKSKKATLNNTELEEFPIRKECISYLILNPRFEFLTKNLIDSIFILLKIPLSISLQKGIFIIFH